MSDLCGIEWEIRRISPADAAEMLSRVAASGHVDKLTLEAFEQDMRAGRWLLNGAPIIVSSDDQVLDGRARLHACVRSGNAFETLIIKGIKKDAFETIDSIRKRTLADVLSIRSEIHGRSLGAALRIIWSYQAGATPGTGKAPGTTALLSVLEQHPEIRDSVIPALRAMPLLPHGCGIALHYLASRTNPEKADLFIAQLGEPVSADPSHPIIQLRSALEGLRGQGGARKQTYILAIAIKAWNAFSRGKVIKHLRYGAERESFPRLDRDPSWGLLGEATERDRSVPPPHQGTLRVRATMVTPEMAEAMLADRGPRVRTH